jgi:hypothetical protein
MLYVDCDSHILPEDAFDEVAPEFRARGPRLIADEKGVRVVYEARQKKYSRLCTPYSQSV